jgi:hypothetical protein
MKMVLDGKMSTRMVVLEIRSHSRGLHSTSARVDDRRNHIISLMKDIFTLNFIDSPIQHKHKLAFRAAWS